MIELKNISIQFDGESSLLTRVNIAVPRGNTFVVVGPSGTGKSVILKIIAGLVEPTSGQVLISERDLFRASRKERAELMQKMGMLFQKNALFDSFTVADNLAFPLREATDFSEHEIQEKVKQFLEYVGLSHAANLFPDEISGGMQKRVGVARALILNPDIILYDDPTAGLDPITSRIIIDLIIKLNEQFGTTVVAITNDMNRAYQMADQIGIILGNTLKILGTVDETKHHPDKAVQQFIRGEFVGGA